MSVELAKLFPCCPALSSSNQSNPVIVIIIAIAEAATASRAVIQGATTFVVRPTKLQAAVAPSLGCADA